MIYIIVLARLALELLAAHRPRAIWEVLYGILILSCGILILFDHRSSQEELQFGSLFVLIGIIWAAISALYFFKLLGNSTPTNEEKIDTKAHKSNEDDQ